MNVTTQTLLPHSWPRPQSLLSLLLTPSSLPPQFPSDSYNNSLPRRRGTINKRVEFIF